MSVNLNDLRLIKFVLFETSNDSLPDLDALSCANSSIWIASGLAKIAAVYGAAMVEQYIGCSARFMTALEYCQKPLLKALPVQISLRGRHEDAVNVAKSVINRAIASPILITGDSEGPTALKLKESCSPIIAKANLPDRDARFVNCASIYMLSALTYRVVAKAFCCPAFLPAFTENDLMNVFDVAQKKSRLISDSILSIANWQKKQFIILGCGASSELTQPWSSILAEAGILTPVVLDMKDYTHGDHLAAMRSKESIFIVISSSGIEDICKLLVSRFSLCVNVIVVDLKATGPALFWENLFSCCNVTSILSESLGFGGKRPPKDPLVYGWRGWGSIE